MRRSLLPLALGVAGVPWLVPAGHANATPLPPTPATHAAPMAADTGALAPGRRPVASDYARYTLPAHCLAAAQNARDGARRAFDAQEQLAALRRTPAKDTLPAGAIAVARACLAHLGGRAVLGRPGAQTDDELRDVTELALLAGDDATAAAALDHRVARAAGDSVRGAILIDGIKQYLTAEPARVAAATAVVARVDALGSVATAARFQAHTELLVFHIRTLDRAAMRAEAEWLQTHARAQLAANPHWGGGFWPARMAAWALMTLAVVEAPDVPDSLTAVTIRARELIRAAIAAEPPPTDAFMQRALRARNAPFLDPAPAAMVQALLPAIGQAYAAGPKAAPEPPLTADFVFPPPGMPGAPGTSGTPTAPVAWPTPGKVSLLLDARADLDLGLPTARVCAGTGATRGTRRTGGAGASAAAPAPAYPRRPTLGRWLAQYGGAGLAVTIATGTAGFTPERGAVPPTAEAERVRCYFQDYLGLPVTVAVQVLPIQTLPEPDGRRKVAALPTHIKRYGPSWERGRPAEVVLADRAGRLLYAGGVTPLFEVMLSHAVTGSVVGGAAPGAADGASPPPTEAHP